MATRDFPSSLEQGFEPQRSLGAGGMGEVFLARDRTLDRPVAIKVVRGALDEELRRRFQREAAHLARLVHPNIVRVYDHGVADGQPFIVMEHLEGRSLDRVGELEDPLEVLLPIAAALEEVHRAGLVHRDVKPANILLTDDGRPVLIDFGLLRTREQTRLTRTGFMVGTPAYLAPECMRSQELTGAVDWYAWGVSLYRLLEGEVPFETSALIAWMSGGAPPRLRFERLPSGDPRRVLVARCLEEDPAARPRSRAELEDLLERARRAGGRSGEELATGARVTRRMPDVQPASTTASSTGGGPGALAPRAVVSLLICACLAALLSWGGRAPRTEAGAASVAARGAEPPPPLAAETGEELAFRHAGLTPLGVNDRGHREYLNERDGARMILIRAGSFRSRSSDQIGRPSPGRRVDHGAFLVDAYEVSVDRFRRFLEATGGDPPELWAVQQRNPDFPVVLVSLRKAIAYCAWAQGRIPTHLEWERAASGEEGHDYPWGEAEPDDTRANVGKVSAALGSINPFPFLGEVASRPEGRSPCGAYNMAGNVMEWVYRSDLQRHRYVGGNFVEGPRACTTWYHGESMTLQEASGVGFRMVRDVPGNDRDAPAGQEFSAGS